MTTGIFIVSSVVLVFVFLAALPRINSWWLNRNLVPDQGLVEPSAESPLSEEREIVVSLEELVDEEPELGEIVVSLEELVDQEPQASDDVFEQQVEDSVNKKSFGSRLAKAKSAMSGYVTSIRNSEVNESIWEQLEEALIVADVGVAATSSVLDRLKKTAEDEQITKGPELLEALKVQMKSDLDVDRTLELNCEGIPVWLFVGVNGVGKTTTIGKLGQSLAVQGHSVVMAAGDTFRAAAVEQLQVWGERNDIPVIAQKTGADAASVVYDAYQSAIAKNIDILIADTAGRLHTQDNLMQELEKIKRVLKKHNEDAPHETLLVIDGGSGQNAIQQANEFHKSINLSGLAVTKLDGTAKGGVLFAISDSLKLPIRFIGVGEAIDDLKPFNAKDFVDALFD